MKKHFYLTLLLALFSAATVWAKFAPEEGKMYALKETTSGLYLDIQTLGIKDATANCDNVSLNATPCVIYFEAGTNDGTWKLKNSNGMYVYYTGDNANGTIWNPRIGTAANQVSDWYVTESNGKITISREAANSYIYVETIEAGKPLYCSNSTGMQFELVDLSYARWTLVTTGNNLLIKDVATNEYLNMHFKDPDATLHTGNGDASQWKIIRVSDETAVTTVEEGVDYYLQTQRNASSGQYAYVSEGNTIQTKSAKDENSYFRFVVADKDNGYYLIKHTATGRHILQGSASGSSNHVVIEVEAEIPADDEETAEIVGTYTLKTITDTYLGPIALATGLLTDGVYTIQGDANGQRGYMVAGEGYQAYPVLTEITYSGSEGNSVTPITNGKNWYITTKNAGVYIYNLGISKYLVVENGVINFSDTPYAWSIMTNGNYKTIYDPKINENKYLSMGCGRAAANRPIALNNNKSDGGSLHTFTAVENGATTFATQITAVEGALASMYTFLETPTSFKFIPFEGNWYIKRTDVEDRYIGSEHDWNVTNDQSLWTVLAANEDGFAAIVRQADNDKHLGSDSNTNVGTGIYTNVSSDCNKWYFTGTYNVPTAATVDEGNYSFTSGLIKYAGACNKLRFTLTESAGKYNGGTYNRFSLDYFELRDAKGNKVELDATAFTGNNAKSYANMLDEVNDNYCRSENWNTATTSHDWFEFTLDKGVDLGGAFSFHFVTENTDMNAKAFEIVTSYEKPVDYIFHIDAPQEVSITYNSNAIADGDKITADYDEALFGIEEITGYATKFVVDKEAKTLTLVYVKQYSISLVDVPDGVTITYDGTDIATGSYISDVIDTEVLSITDCPNNYTWDITADHTNKLVTITFTELVTVENPASVVALIKRIGGDAAADKFKFVLVPSLNYDQETFVIGSEDNKVLIKGTTISAITTGIGWYLQNIAHINIAWNSLNEKTADGGAYADLSSLPMPTGEETHTGDAIYRYYLNYCTFGYSMTTWTWKRWQQEIDWMALHGINMPLQIIGLEEVWRKFLTLEENGARKYNYTDEEAKAFVPGPAFTAWWGMNNLEGWGGTDAGGWGGVQDDDWYTRQQQLATYIVTRQRELGMQPVLPGFSGMVPSNFQTKTGVTCDAGSWCGFTRPKIVLPSNARFAEIAADYYKCLKEVMGESKYYSIDPFHEGGSISGGTNADYDAAYAAIYQAMEQAKPGSLWVIQQWQWSDNNHQRRSLNAVPAGRLVVLDLFSDGKPFFDSFGTNGGYAPQDAVFCAIPNFGGRSGLMGRLQNVTDNYFLYKNKYATIKGVGAAPEAIEQTPVTYDLIFQLPWMGSKPDVAEWVDNYSIARYGKDNAEVKEAWSLLRQGVLNYGADAIQGPVEDVWAARPNLDATPASSWGSTISKGKTPAQSTYTKARRQMLIDATYRLLGQKDALELVAGSVYESNYSYDIVEMGGGVLADYAHDLLLAIGTAKTAAGSSYNDDATYIARRDAFLALIADVDEFKGTNLNFRLGKWTQEARDAAGEVENATTATPDWYEYNNARTIITTWGDQYQNGNGGLRDYSYRSWQGLLKDYYLPRWQYYFNNNCTGPSSYFFFEWNWAHGKTHAVGDASKSTTALAEGATGYSYSREPEGNTVEKANEVLGKYIIPVKLADGSTYYAYRYLSDDLSLTLTTTQGATLDLSEYITFGNTDGLTMSITSNLIDGTATDLSAVTIKADACGDADSVADVVTVALSDGTSLTLTVVVETSALATAKEELATLIEQMETLTSQVATFDVEGYKEVVGDLIAEGTAGTTNLYVWTNAQEDEEGPIKNLVDGSVETHFHSEYKTNVGAYHFINVDLGSEYALSSFKFSYSTRKAETNFPKTIEVSGCNEREGEYKYLATFTDLPVGNTTSAVEYVSDRIVAAQKYAYLRFTVTANNSGGTEGGGHPFFHMSEFNLYKASTTATVFKIFEGTELTNDFAAGKYDVLLDAMAVYENAATAGELTDATTALQQAYNELKALYDALDAKLQYIDEGVYKINYGGAPLFIAHSEPIPDAEKSKTGDAAGYKLFDGTTSNTAEVNKETHQAIIDAQAGADALFTITHNGAGYSLSAQGKYLKSTTTGYWGVLFFSDDEAEAGVYLFEETENDAYKLKSNNDDFQYVNDWGEYFGNDQSNKENLSTFTLTPVTEYTVTVDESRYTTLCLPFNVVLPAGVTAYDVVDVHLDGLRYEYRFAQVATEGQVLAKNTPVVIEADAADYVFNITMSDEDAKGSADGSVLRGALVKTTTDAQKHNYELAVVDGDAAFAKMLGNEVAANSCWLQLDESKGNVIYSVNAEDPKVEVLDGAVYRIKGRLSTGDMRTLYTNGGNKTIKWAADGTKDDVSTLFVAQKVGENQFKFVSVLADGVWNQDAKLGEDGVTLTLYAGSATGTFMLVGENNRLFCVDNEDLDFFSGAGIGGATVNENVTTDFVFEEEVERTYVKYTLTMAKDHKWATLYLPYEVVVPEGVEAYIAHTPDSEKMLLQPTGGVVPAYTPVVIYRDADEAAETKEYVFYYTAAAPAVAAEVENALTGKLIETVVEGKEDYRYYMLLTIDAEEAFYWILEEYDANGNLYPGGDKGYIKCAANKAYMELAPGATLSASYSFRFPGTTGVDGVEAEAGEVDAIYDLQGRKLLSAPEKGVYIVNGKLIVK